MLKTNIMKIKTVLLIAIAMLANLLNAQAQNVYIPDSIFKAALVNNASINTNMDTAIQVAEANAYTGAIHVAALGITDLTGIAAFIAIDSLDCSGNQLTALNVSGCIALTTLDCSWNSLANLNISGCIALNTLSCSYNQLSNLNVSGCTALIDLRCYYNQLTSLNISSCIALTTLNCCYNQLSNLNVSGCIALTTLYCHGNQLTGLNITANTALVTLICFGNQLTTLNVSGCIALTTLDCSINQLLNLNVSGCIGIGALYCSSNQLTSLNIKNGNNHNMGSSGFKATNNPNLRCIEVDSAAWSTFYWTYWSNSIDSTASFSENCNYGSGIRNNTIEQSKALQMYPNPTTGIINLTANSNMELTDITGKVLMQKQNSKQLDISTLPVGIYLLRTGDNLNHTFKVIKE